MSAWPACIGVVGQAKRGGPKGGRSGKWVEAGWTIGGKWAVSGCKWGGRHAISVPVKNGEGSCGSLCNW